MSKIIGFDIETRYWSPSQCPMCKAEFYFNTPNSGFDPLVALEGYKIYDSASGMLCPVCGHEAKSTYDFVNYTPMTEYDVGITCAGFSAFGNGEDRYKSFAAAGEQMSQDEVIEVVSFMAELADRGFVFSAHNGGRFDWPVIYRASGNLGIVKALALDSLDLALYVHTKKGYQIGLDTLAAGLGLEGKKHTVVLTDGTEIEITGALAPILWLQGEKSAVLEYLEPDCRAARDTARYAMENNAIFWSSVKGKAQSAEMSFEPTIRNCMANEKKSAPSWMTGFRPTAELVGWLKED